MTPSDQPQGAAPVPRGFFSAGIVVTSLFLLLLSLGTSAFLTFSALGRAQVEILSERFELLGRESGNQIEAGLRFGRPLEQFLGLDEILGHMRDEAAEIGSIIVTNATGGIIGTPEPAPGDDLREALVSAAARSGEAAQRVEPFDLGEDRYFATPLRSRDGRLSGLLVISVPLAELSAQRDSAVGGNFAIMLIITGLATSLLAIAAGRLRGAMARPNVSRWRWMLFPLVILLTAQVAYSTFVLQVFRTNLSAATLSAAETIGERVEHDLDRLLALGLTFNRMPGLDAQLATLLQLSGAVSQIEIVDADGVVQASATRPPEHVDLLPPLMPVEAFDTVERPLVRPDGSPAGAVRIHVNELAIKQGVFIQTVNIITVAVTSAFFMIELFVLMQILFRRAVARAAAAVGAGTQAAGPAVAPRSFAEMVRTEPMQLIARPVMFGFIFSWALPLSFLPIKMRSLGGELFGLPQEVVMALPISVEMGCALVTAVLAGRLADRRGWHIPFLFGLVLSAVAGVLASLAPNELLFVLARGVTGLGYGLAWMGIQAFVVQNCPDERRGQALANLMAGILTGFITGSAVGGIVAEQFGHDVVLMGTAVMVLAPLVIGLMTLRRFMRRDVAGGDAGRGFDLRRWVALLRSPEYMGILVLSVVPFSIAQVGLLYFAIPLYIDKIGATSSDAGRVLMVYGMVVILLGPILSGMIDRSRAKVKIVIFGGVLGGAGLTLLFVDLRLEGVAFAAGLLSLSSVLIEPARAGFVLNLRVVRSVGLASALGLQRAADKMGQMIGPLVIAVAFSSSEIVQRVAFVGVGFVIASLFLAALVIMRGHMGEAARGRAEP